MSLESIERDIVNAFNVKSPIRILNQKDIRDLNKKLISFTDESALSILPILLISQLHAKLTVSYKNKTNYLISFLGNEKFDFDDELSAKFNNEQFAFFNQFSFEQKLSTLKWLELFALPNSCTILEEDVVSAISFWKEMIRRSQGSGSARPT